MLWGILSPLWHFKVPLVYFIERKHMSLVVYLDVEVRKLSKLFQLQIAFRLESLAKGMPKPDFQPRGRGPRPRVQPRSTVQSLVF